MSKIQMGVTSDGQPAYIEIEDPPVVAEGAPFLIICSEDQAHLIPLNEGVGKSLLRMLGPGSWTARGLSDIQDMFGTLVKIMERRIETAGRGRR